MPPPPLIERPGLRSAVLGLVMSALLVLALLTATGLTGAPLVRPRPAAPPPINLHGAVLAAPPGWVLAQTLRDAQGVDTGWEMIDTSQPGRRLRVYRVAAPADASPTQVLTGVLPRLLAGRRPITRFKTPEQDLQSPGPGVFELFFSTRRFSRVGDDGSPQVHAIAAVQPDAERCWVIQLTTLMPAERWSEAAEVEQIRELREILNRLTIAPG